MCITYEVGSLLDRQITNQKSTLSLLYNILILIGSAVLIVGLIIPYWFYPNLDGHPGHSFLFSLTSSNDVYYKFVDVVLLLLLIIVLMIFLSGFLALLGRKIKRLSLFGNSTISFILLIFILFVPIFSFTYFPFLGYIGHCLTTAASCAAYSQMRSVDYEYAVKLGLGFYMCLVGILLLLISFLPSIILVIQNWGNYRNKSRTPISEKKLLNLHQNKMNLILSILCLIASVGVILGLVTPTFYWVYRGAEGDNTLTSFLTPESSYNSNHMKYLDVNVLIYLTYFIMLLSVCIIVILSYFKKLQITKPKLLLFIFLVIVLIIPSSNPEGEAYLTIPAIIYTLMIFYFQIYDATYSAARYDQLLIDEKHVLSFTFWFMIASLILLFLILLTLVYVKFFVRKDTVNTEQTQK